MEPILSQRNRPLLGELTRRRVLIGFDFDGTLAPVVKQPREAAMRPTTRTLLEQVARLYPCVVISGRSLGDTLRRVRGVGLAAVVGNHGAESERGRSPAAAPVARWHRLLSRRLGAYPGVTIEDKVYSIAVHYRRCRNRRAARVAILAAAGALRGARVIGGRQVVNVVPAGAADKGVALDRLRRELRCDVAVFVGDDWTDEDAFALARRRPVLGIRLGRRPGSAARYYLPSQRDIDRLLRRLLEARQPGAVARGRPRASSRRCSRTDTSGTDR